MVMFVLASKRVSTPSDSPGSQSSQCARMMGPLAMTTMSPGGPAVPFQLESGAVVNMLDCPRFSENSAFIANVMLLGMTSVPLEVVMVTRVLSCAATTCHIAPPGARYGEQPKPRASRHPTKTDYQAPKDR